MAIFDCNGDGYDDYGASSSSFGIRSHLENLGNFTFRDYGPVVDDGGRGYSWADINDDGFVDLIGRDNSADVWLNGGDCRSFAQAFDPVPKSNNNENVFAFDVDGDGDVDVCDPGEQVYWHEQISTNPLQFYYDTSQGYEQTSFTFPGIPKPSAFNVTPTFTNGEGSTASDINGDNVLDILYKATSSLVELFLGERNSTSGRITYSPAVPASSVGLPDVVADHENMNWVWGDCDNDGDLDVFISGSSGQGLYRNVAGYFTTTTATSGLAASLPVAADGAAFGDFDNDGDLDLLVTPGKLYRGAGDCTFTDASTLLPASIWGTFGTGADVAFTDLDRDGDLDVVASSGDLLKNNIEAAKQLDYIHVWAIGAGGGQGSRNSPTTPFGAHISLYSTDGSTLYGMRELTPTLNNVASPWIQHFGLPPGSRRRGPNSDYQVKVEFPSGRTQNYIGCIPSQIVGTAPAGNLLAQTLIVRELDFSNPSWGGNGSTVYCPGCSTANCSWQLPANNTSLSTTTLGNTGTTTGTTGTTPREIESSSSAAPFDFMLIVFIAAAVCCCLIVLIVIAVVVMRKRRNDHSELVELESLGNVPETPGYNTVPSSPGQTYTALPSSASSQHNSVGSTSPDLTGYGSVPNPSSPTGKKSPRVEKSNVSWEVSLSEISFGEELGRGSFGVVYAGEWRGSPVAIKSLLLERTSPQDREEFYAEAQVMATLRPHSNVVQFQGMAEGDGNLYLITEYCGGGSLYSLLQSSAELPRALQVKFARGIAAAMLHLSSEGLVHRDLAARNVLLSESQVPKVADFGMSRLTAGEDGGQTAANVGPLKWMAPESLMNRSYSEKSDVWAFGVVLYELLSRKEPYPDLPAFQVATMMASEATRPRLDRFDNDHPELQKVIDSCMVFAEKDRPRFSEISKTLAKMK